MVFLQTLLSGLSAGSAYALLAVGLVLVYKTTRVVNFAHGSFAMLSAFIAYEASRRGAPLFLALASGVIFAFVLGAAVYHGVLRHTRPGGPHSVVIATLALLMIIEGLAGLIWGTDSKDFHHVFATHRVLSLGSLVLSAEELAVNVAAASLAIGLALFFRHSRAGLILRAVQQDRQSARLLGIDVPKIELYTFGAATALGAVAGLLLAPRVFLDPSMMFFPMLKAFAACVLGGMHSVLGALVGAWIIGALEALVGAYLSTDFQASIAFIVIIIVLMLRPYGLFGQPSADRV